MISLLKNSSMISAPTRVTNASGPLPLNTSMISNLFNQNTSMISDLKPI